MNSPHRFDRYLGTLWRNRDFRTLWLSLTITHFGGQVTLLALPLTAAILLKATPVEMGILVAMEALPYTLLGLFTGVLVDRSRKLRLIIQADIGRGVVLLLVPIAAWGGFLSMSILYVVGFLVGLGGIVGWAAYQVFMAERVGRDKLVEANSRIALSDSASQLIGPGLAGAIIHALTAPIAMLLDALAFFISAFMLRGIKAADSDAPKLVAAQPTLQTSSQTLSLKAVWNGIWADVKEGLAMIWRSPILRSIAISLMIWNFLKFAYLAIVILFATRDLGFSAGQIGTIFMTSGLGLLLASASCQRLNKRLGIGTVMLVGLAISGASWLMVAAVSIKYWPALHFGAALFLFSFGAMIFFINYLTLRQAATPDHLRGRVTSTMIFLAMVLAPLGSLMGGYLGEYLGLRTTIAIAGAGGLVLGGLMLWKSPLRAMRELPEPLSDASLSSPATTS